MTDIRLTLWQLDAHLPLAPFARVGGSLLLMAGLPGAGKSSVVQALQRLLPCVVISTDWVRRQLFLEPTYGEEEIRAVYEMCYKLIRTRLAQGQRVIFDASNHRSERRDEVIAVGRGVGAPVTLCYIAAEDKVVRQRLHHRHHGGRRRGDLSDANWDVYELMKQAYEPIMQPHIELDSSYDRPATLAGRLERYWLANEDRSIYDVTYEFDIQSLSGTSDEGGDDGGDSGGVGEVGLGGDSRGHATGRACD